MNWRSTGKWTGIAAGSVFVIALLALTGLYFGLHSPAFNQAVVAKLTPLLERAGIRVNRLGAARIDLLGSVVIRDLDIQWQDPELGELRLVAGKLDLVFSPVSFLSTPTIDRAALENASVTARIPSEPDEEPLDWGLVEQLLDTPPLSIEAKAWRTTDLDLDLVLEEGEYWQRVQASVDEASGDISWHADEFRGSVRLAITEDAERPWRLVDGNADEALEVRFIPASSSDVTWHITKSGSGWKLKTMVFEHETSLMQPTVYSITDDEPEEVGALDSFELKLQGDVASAAGGNDANGLVALFPLKVNARVKTAMGLNVDGLHHQGLVLTARGKHDLQLDLNGQVDPFEQSPPILHVDAEQALSVEHLDVDYDGQHVSVGDFAWHLLATADSPVNAQLVYPAKYEFQLESRAKHVTVIQDAAAQTDRLEASFRPALHVKAAGQLGSLAEFAQSLSAQFQPQLSFEQIAVVLGQGKSAAHYRIAKQQLSGHGAYSNGHLDWDGTLGLYRISAPEIAKTFSLQNRLRLKTDATLSQPRVDIQVDLDEKPLASMRLAADNLANNLTLRHTLELALPRRLSSYHPQISEVVRTLGTIAINTTGSLHLQHGGQNLQSSDFTLYDKWPLNAEGTIGIVQEQRPGDKDGIILSGPTTIAYSLTKAKDYQTNVRLQTAGIQLAPLEQPIPLRFENQTRFSWPLTTATAIGGISIAGSDALNYKLTVRDQPRRLKIDADLGIAANADWHRYLPQLNALATVGQLNVGAKLGADFTHPDDSILQFDPVQLSRTRAQVKLDTRVNQSTDIPGSVLQLSGPATLSQRLGWTGEQISWEGKFNLTGLELVKFLAMDRISGALNFEATPGMTPATAELTAHIDETKIRLLEPTAGVAELEMGQIVTPLDLRVSARHDDKQAELKRFDLTTGRGALALRANGKATLDGKNVELESGLKAELKPGLFANSTVSGDGSIEVPWRVTMIDGEQVTLEGELRFADVDITIEPYRIQKLDGSLKVEEELLWTPEQTLKFRYLVSADPFQRVDFNRIQPFLDNRQVLSVARVHADDETVGPALASTLLKQNMLRLQHFDLELFGGHVTGQAYLDATPGAWKIGLLSRLSQIDPRRLLPKDSLYGQSAYAPISARSAVEFDVNKRLIEGRIDITAISREQLLQLLEVADPQHQDEQLARVRTALRLAYPQSVSVVMSRGLMDLEVAVSALPNTIRVRGLPLSPLIQHFAGETLESLERVPLE